MGSSRSFVTFAYGRFRSRQTKDIWATRASRCRALPREALARAVVVSSLRVTIPVARRRTRRRRTRQKPCGFFRGGQTAAIANGLRPSRAEGCAGFGPPPAGVSPVFRAALVQTRLRRPFGRVSRRCSTWTEHTRYCPCTSPGGQSLPSANAAIRGGSLLAL
jgi:hypothetical protein